MSISLRRPPETADKKFLYRNSAYTLGTRLYMASRGDHRTNGRGKGPRFELQRSSAGESAWLEVQFNDWIEMGGGELSYVDAALGDWVCMRIFAPPSQLTPTPGTGNCIVSNHVVVPYTGGTHTLDVTTADQAIPLLVSDASGYWQWSYPNEGCGTLEPRPAGDGNCHVMDVQNEIHTYVQEVGMLGSVGVLSFTYPGIDPTRIPPQWKIATRVHHAGGSNVLAVSWVLVCARMNGSIDHS